MRKELIVSLKVDDKIYKKGDLVEIRTYSYAGLLPTMVKGTILDFKTDDKGEEWIILDTTVPCKSKEYRLSLEVMSRVKKI